MTVSIRSATESDLARILALFAELNPDDEPLPEARASETWGRILAQEGHEILVAELDDRVVGCCVLVVVPNLSRSARPFAVIENVIVDSRYRRRGIGARILQEASDAARREGCYKVMFMSSAKRTEAHRFYETVGFDGSSKRAFERRL